MCHIVLLKVRLFWEELAGQRDQQLLRELHINKVRIYTDKSSNQKISFNNYLFDDYYPVYQISLITNWQWYNFLNFIYIFIMSSSKSKVDNSHEYPSNDQIYQEENDDKSYLKRRNYDGSLQNGQLTNFYFKKSQEIQISLSIIVIINIYFIIVVNQLTFPQLKSQHQSTMNICLYFSIICVLISIILVSMRSLNLLKLEKEQKKIYKKENIYSTNKIIYLLCEWIILIMQPYPFFIGTEIQTINAFQNYSIKYPLNDLLSIFSFARVYIILRSSLLITPYMSNRSQRLCKMYGCQVDYSYALKCLFKEHPLKLICIMYSLTALIFAYLIYLAERQLVSQGNTTFNNSAQYAATKYPNALWLILITTTTVGYGDYFPQTPLGRMIIVLVAIWGTLIVSIMVVVVSNTLNMQKNQIRTSKILNKLQLRQQLQQKAGRFIGYFMMHSLSRQRIKRRKYLTNKFMASKKEFESLKRTIKQLTQFDDLQDQIATHFLKLNNDIEILNINQDKIIDYIHDNFNKSTFWPQKKKQQIILPVKDIQNDNSDVDSQDSSDALQMIKVRHKLKQQ